MLQVLFWSLDDASFSVRFANASRVSDPNATAMDGGFDASRLRENAIYFKPDSLWTNF